MESSKGQEPRNEIADILGCVRKKGVSLWSENGHLHYRAPKGVLTSKDIDRLVAFRAQIIELLQRSAELANTERPLEPRGQSNRAPLTFSQLSGWYLNRSAERSGRRNIASATRLQGQLDLGALKTSLDKVALRHEALRTGIAEIDGIPQQLIRQSVDYEFEFHDLMAVPRDGREAELMDIIDQFILEPIDLAKDPLFGVRLVALEEHEYVLIMGMEHMISDAISLNILLRDVFTTYRQEVTGCTPSLPQLPVQFADYAVWQMDIQKSWLQKHGLYWEERLRGAPRLRFPESTASPMRGLGTVSINFDRKFKIEIKEWSRLRRTTIAMSVLTAYVCLILRWYQVSEAVIRYQSDGRTNPKVENVIGFFSSALYLRIQQRNDETFSDLLAHTTEEYCSALEHADFSRLDAQVPRPEFSRNPGFNWIPQEPKADLAKMNCYANGIHASGIRFVNPLLKKISNVEGEPFVELWDIDDEIVGAVYFQADRFSPKTMARFANSFVEIVKILLRRPNELIRNISLW